MKPWQETGLIALSLVAAVTVGAALGISIEREKHSAETIKAICPIGELCQGWNGAVIGSSAAHWKPRTEADRISVCLPSEEFPDQWECGSLTYHLTQMNRKVHKLIERLP